MSREFIAFGAPQFTDAEIEAVARAMRSGWVGMGPETLAFERELASYLGAPEIVSVNSCTSALFLALLVEGVGAGDEVIVPSLTFCASANAALYLGATPVFCDVDTQTFCATPQSIVSCLTEKTRAVMVVHYGGRAVDVRALAEALPANVTIVEDAAHAMGARYPDGKLVGASGNPVCFSFYANKNISTGDGGAIALSDPAKAERLRTLRMSGMSSSAWSRYVAPTNTFEPGIEMLGYKMGYMDLLAAIARVQLSRLGEMAALRQELVLRYRDRLQEAGLAIPFQAGVFDRDHARHLLVALFEASRTGYERDDLLLALRKLNIGASIHYQPLHTMPLYQPYQRAPLPATESVCNSMMTLPIGPRMTPSDVDYVVSSLASLIRPADSSHAMPRS